MTDDETIFRAAVVGGGTMGAGIAHAMLLAGIDVTLVERDARTADAARRRVGVAVDGSVERGIVAGPETLLVRLDVTVDIGRAHDAQIAIEAVPEDLELKIEALTRLAGVIDERAVIASNTSSISVDALAAAVPHPERVLGMHFFNPVPTSKLVEVVDGGRTSPETAARAQDIVRRLGKTPIVVRDSPGFASSRLGVAIGLEAIRMLEEDVASAEDIDAAMMLGYGFPIGPLRLTDLVGLDVRLGIARYLESQLGDRFTPPPLLVEMVAAGRLGKKSGRGFYDWATGR
ncbi:MAG: 3-hydroxyacyl-CoA dehydrogenase family protein [Microbacterium sp.]|uniref:3-hydroxyacyl-CoA dehydrogenase family protein n=1 Tax=Microbacterium sp. TaxID=51671 RepID=UPI0039E2E311